MSKADVEWKSEPLLNNKWLALSTQLRTQRGKRPTVDLIRALTQHPKYQDHNPNSIYALLGTFFRTGGPNSIVLTEWVISFGLTAFCSSTNSTRKSQPALLEL